MPSWGESTPIGNACPRRPGTLRCGVTRWKFPVGRWPWKVAWAGRWAGPWALAVAALSCQPYCLPNDAEEGSHQGTNHVSPWERFLAKHEANSSPSKTHRRAPQSLGPLRPCGSTVALEQRESSSESPHGDGAGTSRTWTRVRQVTQDTSELAPGAPRRPQPATPQPALPGRRHTGEHPRLNLLPRSSSLGVPGRFPEAGKEAQRELLLEDAPGTAPPRHLRW